MAEKIIVTFDQFTFKISPNISVSSNNRIVKHNYAGQNGAHLIPLGWDNDTVSIKVYFYRDNYHELIPFLNHLKANDYFQFLDPILGSIEVCVDSINRAKDNRIDLAEIDLELSINGVNPEPTRVPEVSAEAEESYIKGVTDAETTIKESIIEDFGAEGVDIVETPILTTFLEALEGYSARVREWATEVDQAIGKAELLGQYLEIPANSLSDLVALGTNAPGRILGIGSSLIEKHSNLITQFEKTSDRVGLNVEAEIGTSNTSSKSRALALDQSFEELKLKFRGTELEGSITVMAALNLSVETAYKMQEDEEASEKLRSIEKNESFDLEGNFIGSEEETTPLATVIDLEEATALVRTRLVESLNFVNNKGAIKNMALLLQEHVDILKSEKDKIIEIDVLEPTPLHIICRDNNLPYNMAPRLIALNDISNPTFVVGKVLIYDRT
jgi:hypothetical protein